MNDRDKVENLIRAHRFPESQVLDLILHTLLTDEQVKRLVAYLNAFAQDAADKEN